MFLWQIKKIINKMFLVNGGEEITKKTKVFSFSILSGFVVAFIALLIVDPGNNPISAIFRGVKNGLSSELGVSQFGTYISILGLAGIAVGIGFKTGLFNIGVSGQMIVGGMSAGLIALSLKDSIPNGVGQILIIFVSILLSASIAAVAGILKSFLRIHEVVSTILINWIAFFYMKWMLDPNSSTLLDDQTGMIQTFQISSHYLLRFNDNPLWPSLIILFVTAIIAWFIIYKTKFGFKLKMTGLNKDGAEYAGVNVKLTGIYSMAFSGAVAGLLGAVLYFGMQNRFQVPKADSIPLEGFNGIAIALIGFSNPVLMIPVSLLFGFVKIGVEYSHTIDPVFINLIMGILMYITAIGMIFNKLQLLKWGRILFKGKKYQEQYHVYRQTRNEINVKYYDKYSFTKEKEKKNLVIQEHNKVLRTQKEKFKSLLVKGGK